MFERVDRHPPTRLVSAAGAEWLATPTAWVAPAWMVAAGRLVASRSRHARRGDTVLYATCIAGSVLAHQLGTIAAARLAGAPLAGVVFTATLAYNTYPSDEGPQSRRVHITRALGGPLGNLALCAATLAIPAARRHRITKFVGVLNGAFTVAALTPLPTMDGGAILRQLRSGSEGVA